ncbi:MAG: molecular chaperone TorD family protein [Chloroflexi bacterium]|nr:molecular chaperone TorD family protein [Chloroflexota bacterium]
MTFPRTIEFFSRFFFASNANEMRGSYLALAEILPAPIVEDWAAVEFSFNRLFVGPRALLAPPYASIYLEGHEAKLMGESTLQVRQLYEMLGLASPWKNKIPDDHIAFELDALWQAASALEHVDSPQLRDVYDYLLNRLHSWIPKFVARIQSIDDVHPAVLFVAQTLKDVIFSHAEQTASQNAA